jgi:hypothetical protein
MARQSKAGFVLLPSIISLRFGHRFFEPMQFQPGMIMKTYTRYAAVFFLTLFVYGVAHAQNSLRQLVGEAGTQWLIGEWEGRDDQGGAISLSFKWDLNQQAIMGHVKTSQWEGKSITALDATIDEVTYYAVDNRGAIGRGTWSEDNGKPVLKYHYSTPEGESGRVGVVYTRSGQNKVRIEIFALDASQNFIRPARWEVTLTRKN